jgi:AhpD family alkylhydroperoxidase
MQIKAPAALAEMLAIYCTTIYPRSNYVDVLMAKNYKEVTDRISRGISQLRAEVPDTMKAFSALAQAASRDGVLDRKTKELIALALGVAAHCDGCIGFHVQALHRLGASRAEVEEALGMAVYMGGGPSLMYAADALHAFEELAPQKAVLEPAG